MSCVNILLTLMRVDSSNTHAVGSEGKTAHCTDRNRESNSMLGQHTVKVHYYEANWFVLSEAYTLLPLAAPNGIVPCYFHHQALMRLSAFPVVDNRIYKMYGSMANQSINQPVIIFHIQSHLLTEIWGAHDLSKKKKKALFPCLCWKTTGRTAVWGLSLLINGTLEVSLLLIRRCDVRVYLVPFCSVGFYMYVSPYDLIVYLIWSCSVVYWVCKMPRNEIGNLFFSALGHLPPTS